MNKITDAFFTARPKQNKRKESEFDDEPRRLSDSHDDDDKEEDEKDANLTKEGQDFLMKFLQKKN